MDPKVYVNPNLDPKRAAVEVLRDLAELRAAMTDQTQRTRDYGRALEAIRTKLNELAERVHLQGLQIERHRLELVRLRREVTHDWIGLPPGSRAPSERPPARSAEPAPSSPPIPKPKKAGSGR